MKPSAVKTHTVNDLKYSQDLKHLQVISRKLWEKPEIYNTYEMVNSTA